MHNGIDIIFLSLQLSPLNEVGDTEGCTWISESEVKTPTGFKEAYQQYVEGGWPSLAFPEAYGGQGRSRLRRAAPW